MDTAAATAAAVATIDAQPDRAGLIDRVRAALDRAVRPGLNLDGGDVELVGIDDDRIVQVRLVGACSACPSTVYTLIHAMEAEVRAEVPEVRFLEAVP